MNLPVGATAKFIRARDSSTQNLSRVLPEAVAFITEAVSGGGKILVHCFAGVSRSASCVIAYLMKSKQIGYEEALAMTKAKRECVEPNEAFIRQLQEYQSQLGV